MPYPKVPKWPCVAKIYRIFWNDYDDVGYVGHTRHLLLSRRMPGHRADAKKGKKSLIFQKIRERGEFEYELLETIFCQNFDEARTHEKRWKRQLKANLNMISPITTEEEAKAASVMRSARAFDTPERKVYMKTYMKAYDATRVKCECGVEISQGWLPRHKKTKRHLENLEKE